MNNKPVALGQYPPHSTAALVVLTLATVAFGNGQEIYAFPGGYDDLYYLQKAVSFSLEGGLIAPYLAAIKEILYPMFIAASLALGVGLHVFHTACYGFALWLLWRELVALTGRPAVAWITVVPLAFYCGQHLVFTRATEDALQLILSPVTFASCIFLFRDRASWRSTCVAGLLTALQVLTRPEGALYVLPPLAILLLVAPIQRMDRGFEGGPTARTLVRFAARAAFLLLCIPAAEQIPSAANWHYFGFWAPTIMRAGDFHDCLSSLMEIDPGFEPPAHTPVPKASLQQAFLASPTFQEAKTFFEANFDGHGWSSYVPAADRPKDGSIGWGHFQWALLNSGMVAAGPKAQDMLGFFRAVTNELHTAFDSGRLKRRRVLSTTLGPAFSFADRNFWVSAFYIGAWHLNFARPILPRITALTPNVPAELSFNELALRRSALLGTPGKAGWQVSGWVTLPGQGSPKNMTLDQEAIGDGISLALRERPDIAQALLGSSHGELSGRCCGIEIRSPGAWSGNLLITGADRTANIPLSFLKPVGGGKSRTLDGVLIYVDATQRTQTLSPATRVLPYIEVLTTATFYLESSLVIALLLWLATATFLPVARRPIRSFMVPALVVGCIAAAIVIPRTLLLAALEAGIWSGGMWSDGNTRWLASGSFATWTAVSFFFACFFSGLFKR